MKIKAYVWVHDGPAPWHFATIEKGYAEELKKDYKLPPKGFGSIPVNVLVGNTKWKTSIFPDRDGSYLLPLKKEVRVKESIKANTHIELDIKPA